MKRSIRIINSMSSKYEYIRFVCMLTNKEDKRLRY